MEAAIPNMSGDDIDEDSSDPEQWFYEIFLKGGILYRAEESEFIRKISGIVD